MNGISTFCFGASYAVALVLELVRLLQPREMLRVVSLAFGVAGLLAQTLFLLVQRPPLVEQSGSLLFLAWILAVFYLYGSIHHRHQAWAIFVLPLVLGLVILSAVFPQEAGERSWFSALAALHGEQFWGTVHGSLLLLAAVGVCVAFVASVMYLVQAQRLKTKTLPAKGLRLLSLEDLERMNRRAINLAFPLLTVGVLVGVVLMMQRTEQPRDWTDPKILGAAVLWLVFALLLYLRYGYHLRGRRVAFLTIAAFILLLFTLVAEHTSVPGGSP